MTGPEFMEYIRLRRVLCHKMTREDWHRLDQLVQIIPIAARAAVTNAGGIHISDDDIDKLLIRFLAGAFDERNEHDLRTVRVSSGARSRQ